MAPAVTGPREAEPGRLIGAERIPGHTGSEAFRIRYWSTSARGRAVPVSGILYRPAWHPPGEVPVIAWAHGTYGLGDHCTNEAYLSAPECAGIVTLAISRGAVLVATDYEGLGTGRPHPYLVGRVAARNVLDSVLAAQHLGPAGPSSPVLLAGWSQGGNAALLAAEGHRWHASRLRLLGVVAAAPAAELDSLIGWLDGTSQFGYVVMAAYGYRAAYPGLFRGRASPFDDGPLSGVEDLCVQDILDRHAFLRAADVGLSAVLEDPRFAACLRAHSPGRRPTGVPTLVVHGDSDATLPAGAIRRMVDRYARLGQVVDARYYAYVGHADILEAAANEIVGFVDAKLER